MTGFKLINPGNIDQLMAIEFGDGPPQILIKEHLPKKVTPEYLDSQITDKTFTMEPNGKTMICRLTMQNGTVFYGYSHCVDPSEFKQDLGEQYSYKDAYNQAWDREGYLLAWLHLKAAPARQETPAA